MKKMIKVLLAGLSLISVNVFAATVDGSLNVGGAYNATGGVNLGDATGVSLGDVGANGPGEGDILETGTLGFDPKTNTFTTGTVGGSLNLESFSPVTNFFSIGGWQLDVSTLTIVDQSAGTLNLLGLGVLKGHDFDATDVSWSFSSSSTTSYSMTVSSVSPVPVPAAAWLFGSGLLGLVGVARRKT